ncbi:MAG: hypothetical protein ACLQHM_02510 [Limisphaerales bacterium]
MDERLCFAAQSSNNPMIHSSNFVALCSSAVKNRKPHRRLAVGSGKSRERIRTLPPRGEAARLAADSGSNCDSQVKSSSLDATGQMVFFLSAGARIIH